MAYYFAYGSNMNPARVAARIGATRAVLAGRLDNHELRFGKASRVPGIAHANVAARSGIHVEGALYELESPDQIQLMDPFEGVPHHYFRQQHPILTERGVIEAWVYIAHPGQTRAALRPAREYLEHLLAGKAFLSDEYYTRLAAVDAVEGLEDTLLTMLGLSRHSPR